MATPIEGGEVQGNPEGNEPVAPGPNPAWGEALSAIPEQFHEPLTQHFTKWDQSAQQRIESVNQQLGQFEPYKPFVENGISADDLGQGIQLLMQLNQDPRAVYDALKESFGYDSEPQTQQIPGSETDEEEEEDPYGQRFEQLNQGLELVANTVLQQHQEKISREAEANLDAELNQLKEKYPNFDETYVLNLVANGATMEQAAQAYDGLVQSILQQNPRPFAPSVMGNSGGGTGLPSQAIDPTKLDNKGTKNLVIQMLNAANAQD